ncbi:hypothetical protein C5D36_02220 [Rathayibacter sp. AY1C6]|nr:hypothetical protein C5D36_02220 [Rathayibacter sp. AY1C6]
MRLPPRSRERGVIADKAVWFFGAALAVLAVWIGASVYFVLPPNVLSSESDVHKNLQLAFTTVSPQGWGFFTNAPQATEIAAYDAETMASLMLAPQGRVENLFGLSRAQRAQGPELAQLSEAVGQWHECESGQTREHCLAEASSLQPQKITVNLAHRTLCGPIILTTETFTPFEYREFDLPMHSIETFTTVDAVC